MSGKRGVKEDPALKRLVQSTPASTVSQSPPPASTPNSPRQQITTLTSVASSTSGNTVPSTRSSANIMATLNSAATRSTTISPTAPTTTSAPVPLPTLKTFNYDWWLTNVIPVIKNDLNDKMAKITQTGSIKNYSTFEKDEKERDVEAKLSDFQGDQVFFVDGEDVKASETNLSLLELEIKLVKFIFSKEKILELEAELKKPNDQYNNAIYEHTEKKNVLLKKIEDVPKAETMLVRMQERERLVKGAVSAKCLVKKEERLRSIAKQLEELTTKTNAINRISGNNIQGEKEELELRGLQSQKEMLNKERSALIETGKKIETFLNEEDKQLNLKFLQTREEVFTDQLASEMLHWWRFEDLAKEFRDSKDLEERLTKELAEFTFDEKKWGDPIRKALYDFLRKNSDEFHLFVKFIKVLTPKNLKNILLRELKDSVQVKRGTGWFKELLIDNPTVSVRYMKKKIEGRIATPGGMTADSKRELTVAGQSSQDVQFSCEISVKLPSHVSAKLNINIQKDNCSYYVKEIPDGEDFRLEPNNIFYKPPSKYSIHANRNVHFPSNAGGNQSPHGSNDMQGFQVAPPPPQTMNINGDVVASTNPEDDTWWNFCCKC